MSALADRLEAIEKRGGGEAPADAGAAPEAKSADAFEPLPRPPGVDARPASQDAFETLVAPDGFVVDAEPREPEARRRAAPRPEPEAEAPRAKRAAPLGATADADFLNAARSSARTGRGSRSDYVRYEAPDETGPGRGRWILIGASVLSFLIIGAAAGLLILDTLSGGAAGQREAGVQEETLNSLFAEPRTPAATDETRPAAGTPAGETAAETAAETPAEAVAAPAAEPVAAEPEARTAAAAPAGVQAVAAARPRTLEEAAADGDPVARYQLALQRLEAGAMEDGAALMRRAAEQGIPAAQFRYAQMLARGEGVPASADTARLWMARAAQNGNVRAMHSAGAMYINAEATPENQAEAARWFEQAALHGVRDSQFNLALLFQSGYGVPQSPADAYAWFLIAANGGDEAAAGRAQELRRELSAEQRSAAEAVAANFTPRPVDPEAQGRYPEWGAQDDAGPALVLRAQELLARLGYDAGPADGDFGPQTREAIVAYQTDQGLEPTGAVDTTLIARLEQTAPR